jgi:hypothetical protein
MFPKMTKMSTFLLNPRFQLVCDISGNLKYIKSLNDQQQLVTMGLSPPKRLALLLPQNSAPSHSADLIVASCRRRSASRRSASRRHFQLFKLPNPNPKCFFRLSFLCLFQQTALTLTI